MGAQKSDARYLALSVKTRARVSPITQKPCATNPPALTAYAQPNGEKQQSRKPLQNWLYEQNWPRTAGEEPHDEPAARRSHRAEQRSPMRRCCPSRLLTAKFFSSHSCLAWVFRWITRRRFFFSWQSWAFLSLCRALVCSSTTDTRMICACSTVSEGRLSAA